MEGAGPPPRTQSARSGRHEPFEFAADVVAGWLVDQLCHALFAQSLEATANDVGCAGHRDLLDHGSATGVPRSQIGCVQADAVLNVHTEVPLVLGFAIDDGKPLGISITALRPPNS